MRIPTKNLLSRSFLIGLKVFIDLRQIKKEAKNSLLFVHPQGFEPWTH